MHSHVLALRTVLRQAAHHADDLLRLQAQADAEVQAAACSGRAVVQASGTPTRREVLLRDPLTDAERTLLRPVVDLRPDMLDAAPGQFDVPLGQPLANLVVAAVEPDSQNSDLTNRLIDRLGGVQRVLVAPAGGLAPL